LRNVCLHRRVHASYKEQFCVTRINVFEIFGEGSSWLNKIWASLVIPGVLWAGQALWISWRSACRSA